MNRIYRIVFNRALGVPQVVSELDGTSGSAIGGAALPAAGLRTRVLTLAVGLALMTPVSTAWAQSCATSGAITVSCQGSTGTNGGAGPGQAGGSPSEPGAGTGGAAGVDGSAGAAAGVGGAFGGSGGTAGTAMGAGGGGGTYGGGAGGSGSDGTGTPGGSGGLAGMVATGEVTIVAGVSIAGGAGGSGPPVGIGGSGGGGAAGVIFGLANSSLVNQGTVTGGIGGDNSFGDSAGGGGGGGVAMAIMGNGNTVLNESALQGGNGGGGGATPAGEEGSGGGGGAGLGVVGNGNTLENTGSIAGGAGGVAQDFFNLGNGGVGVGISGDNNLLITSGSISGGTSTAGARNDAVYITGNNNILELEAGYSFTGNIESIPGQGNSLELGGSGTAAFTVGRVVGFDSFSVVSGIWTLNGTSPIATPWTVSGGGRLVISDDRELGADAGTLTLKGLGQVELTSDTTSRRSIVLNGTNTLAVDGGSTWTLQGNIGGSGSLAKSGTGTLIIASVLSTDLDIEQGEVQVGLGGTTGSIVGTVQNFGNLVFNRSDTLTVAGNISGSGSLDQSGGGTLILAGTNTWSGTTEIANGTLEIGTGDGVESTLTGAVDNNAALVVNTADLVTLGGVISGAGSFTENGTGTVKLTAANAMTGAVNVNSGTLALVDAGGLAQASSINDNGTFDIGGTTNGTAIRSLSGFGQVQLGTKTLTITNASGTFGGTIAGAGGLTLNGGTEMLIANNGGYDGTTTINGGTLALQDSQLTQGGLAMAGGTLNVIGPSTSFVQTDTSPGQAAVGGTVHLTEGGSYSGNSELDIGVGTAGTVSVDSGARLYDAADIFVGESGTGTLNVSGGGTVTTDSDLVIGDVNSSGAVTVSGTGTSIHAQTLFMVNLGANASLTVSDGASITAGSATIAIGGGGTSALNIGAAAGSAPAAAPALVDLGPITFDSGAGSLVFNHTSSGFLFDDAISGAGTIDVLAGTTIYRGNGTFSGNLLVKGGTLIVGDLTTIGTAALGGNAEVFTGATLGGTANVSSLVVDSGGSLSPGYTGNGYSTFGLGNSVNVGGNLTLNGVQVDVSASPDAGKGLYALFNYQGTLTETNGGLTLGSTPAGDTLSIQHLAAQHQINLIDTGGDTLNFWNANGLASASQAGGGSGTWNNTASIWTDAAGDVTSAMAPQPGFAMFGGASGIVTIDNGNGNVAATGMQFASSGYTMTGADLALVPDSHGNAPTIRVGDGTAGGAVDVAEIDNRLTGTDGLIKADLGTLILTGANTYTGNTTVEAGTLQIGNGGNAGSVAGDIVDNGNVTFNLGANTNANSISGTGTVTLLGPASLFFTSAQTYTGATQIKSGALVLSGNGSVAASSVIDDDYIFDISGVGSDQSVISLSGSGYVILGTNKLTLTGADDTFSGDIVDSGGLQLAGGTEVLTGKNEYIGHTTIDNGATLQIGNGSNTGSIESNVTTDGTLVFDRNDAVGFNSIIDGTGSVAQQGSGNLTLFGTNTYSGGTLIAAGTLTGGAQSFGSGTITDNASLVLSQTGNGTLSNDITGSGQVIIDSQGTVTLAGHNTYIGGTLISEGSLVGNTDSLQGNISLAPATIVTFDQATDGSFAGALGGSGSLVKSGAGTVSFSGDSSSFNGMTVVSGGTLAIDGSLDGLVLVSSGATLAGHGDLGGSVVVNSGATLAPGGEHAVGTLSMGSLWMAQGSSVDMDLGATGSPLGSAGVGDGVNVSGDLQFNGTTLNINNIGGMGGGIYRLFSYGGNLTETNGGLLLGSMPTGQSLTLMNLTSDKQIDLLDTTGLSINVWNGNGHTSGSQLGGGSGTWSITTQDWTDASGVLRGPLSPQPGFAVFGGIAGTITIDDGAGAVNALGMQFASDGYEMQGDTLTLVDNAGAAPIVRVGDGTAQGANYVAQIGNVIAGNAGLDKADFGTLVLTGENTYTGGTIISEGTLQIGNGGTTGSILGNVDNQGTLAFDRSDNVSFAGAVSGAGGLVQKGEGTLTLTGVNSFTGTTVIDSGTLALSGQGSMAGSAHVIDNAVLDISQSSQGASIRSLGGNGTVSLGNQTLTLTDASDTFSGVIGGNGSVAISGGTQVLAGTNTYSGGTTIHAGTLQVGNGGTAGAIVGAVIDQGSLAFDRADAVTFDGAISGNGSVQQMGAGILVLGGNNTYTGGTVVTQGTLSVGSASALGAGAVSMAAGTALSITDGVTLANALTLSGDPDIGVATGETATLSGVIGDGAQAGDLVKTGGGTLVLSGANTYTGGTEVAAGTLDVSGSVIGQVTVDGGAILVGAGSVGDLSVVSGGTVSPGSAAIGSLHVGGDLNLAAGSVYRVDASDTGQSDTIHVDGTATLGGGSVVSIAAGSNWSASTRYTILSARDITGSFGQISSNFAFLVPTLSYDDNNAYLTLARNNADFASVATTRNEIHVANAIAASSNSPLYQAVLPLDAATARAAFDTLAGDSVASTRNAILEDSHFIRDAIQNHLSSAPGAGRTTQADVDGSFWASTWTHGGNQDSDGNAARMRSNGSGLLVGVDRNLDAWRVGAVAGTGQLSNSSVNGAGDAHSTDNTLGLYTGVDAGPWQFQGGAAHSWYDTRTHRHIAVADVQGAGDANDNNNVTQAFVDAGYRMGGEQSSLTPYVDLARAWIHRDAIHESSGIAALDVQGSDTAVNYGSAGLRGAYEPAPGIQLHATLAYQHAWGDLRSTDRQQFTSDPTSFTVDGLPLARNTGIADVGMHFALSRTVSVDASYHGEFSSGTKDQGARMALNVIF
jgi:fibronectin-binding autotransporter adhesin